MPGPPATEERPEDLTFRQLWRFMSFSLPYWPDLVIGSVAGLQRMALGLWMPLLVQRVVDNVGTPFYTGAIDAPEAWSRTVWLAGITLAILLLHGPATLGRQYFPFRAAASALRDIRYELFRHVQRLSLGFHKQRATGGIVARIISDVQAAQQSFDLLAIQFVQMLLNAAVILAIFFWTDWVWALVALASTPLFLVTSTLVRRPMRRASRQARESVEQMSGRVQERMSMIREVQAFTAEPFEEKQVLDAETLRRHTLRQRLLSFQHTATTEISRHLGLLVVLVFGVYRITSGDARATVGALPLFYMYTAQLLNPMQFFANLYTQLHQSAASADRVMDFFDTERDVTNRPGARPLEARRPPAVKFEHVRFAYPTDEPVVVIEDVSFEVAPGHRVVMVGESGAGKSTMLSLLPRFYDVQGGAITIDGQDIRDIKLRSLRQAIAIVPQEPLLFTGTIRQNILYGRQGADQAAIEAAAEAANAHDFILEQPEGYQTLIGERGVGLSGGQVQRIAIARAFLKDPSILIMDEATSNLDATSERLVLDALDRLAAGRTTFIIAHRLSVARSADRIIALAGGRVVETGTHEQLLARGGLYHDLYRRQTAE